jgi:flavorubredoxin
MARVTEIAPDLFQISIFVPEIDLQFNHFLVRDDEPLLFHTGMRRMFPLVREGVAQLLDPGKLRWISFSHFEADECGAINEWLTIAPQAQPACTPLGALLSIDDFSIRPARQMSPEDVLTTGKYRFRFIPTPHLPHGWDANVCFEETNGTLLCSDLFHQTGNREPVTSADIMGRVRQALTDYQAHPLLADYMPYSHCTERNLRKLEALSPRTLAIMHGSAFMGNGAQAMRDLSTVMREVLKEEKICQAA